MNTTSRIMLRLLAVTIITTTSSLLLIKADDSKGSLETDKHALLAFYRALPSIGTRLDWNSDDPDEKICKWIGVYCTDEVDDDKSKVGHGGEGNTKDKRVVELRLPGIGLYGAIVQHSIGDLHALRKLSLRNNSLYGTLPTDILSIPTLKNIHLQHNKFCGDLPEFSGNPPNLVVVDLSFNNFTGEIPDVFGRAEGLQHLDLQSNLFSGFIPPDFKLEHLIKLNLSNNKLQGEIPPSLKKFYEQNSFVGNEDLCGNPLPTPCSAATASAPLSNAAYSYKLPHHIALVPSSLLLFLLLS